VFHIANSPTGHLDIFSGTVVNIDRINLSYELFSFGVGKMGVLSGASGVAGE